MTKWRISHYLIGIHNGEELHTLKFLLFVLIFEPFLLFFKQNWHPILFHQFITPAIIITIGFLYIQKRDKKFIEFQMPLAFLLYACGHFFYRYIGDILIRQRLSYWPLLPVLSIAIFLGLYYILCDSDLKFIDIAIAVAMNLMAIIVFIQLIEGYNPHRLMATLGNPTNVGAYLALGLPFCLKRSYGWGIPLLVAICLLNSASAVLGAVTGLTVYIFLKNKRLGIVLFLIFLLSGVLLINLNSGYFASHGKIQVWKKAIEIWSENPTLMITGFGPGTFEVFGYNDGASWWTHSHNLIIHLLHDYGLIGLLIFISFVIKDIFLKKKDTDLKKKAFASICAFGVVSLGFIPYAIWPCVIILAYDLAILKKG